MSCYLGWLHEWQDFVGALIGGAALIVTVWWTLSSERRKNAEETRVLRIALGVEFKLFVFHVLDAHRKVVNLRREETAIIVGEKLRRVVRFPDPVIYNSSAGSVGVLGEFAHVVVRFYGQVESVPDDMYERIPKTAHLGWRDLDEAAESLLNVVECGIEALPAFAGTPGSQSDEQILREVADARAIFEKLKKS